MTTENTPAEKQTFDEKVNIAVASMVADDNGKMTLPADHGLDESLVYSANAERRRRDTQAAYSKSQNDLKAAKAENSALVDGWGNDVKSVLTNDQNVELEELKATDPEAWRLKLNEYEQTNATALGTKQAAIKTESAQVSEIDRRTGLLEEFNLANPDIKITDQLLTDEVPPKYLKQLEKGEVTFEELLANVKGYLTAGKVIKPGEAPHDDIDMSTVGGSSKPTDQAVNASVKESYKTETY